MIKNFRQDSIKSDPLLMEMKTAGLIVQDIYDNTGRLDRPDIEDTSVI